MLPTEAQLLLFAAIQGLVLILALLFRAKSLRGANVYLSLLIFTVTIELFGGWAMSFRYQSSPNAIPFWLLNSYLLVPVSLLLYAAQITKIHFIPEKYRLWLFMPAFIEIAAELINFYLFKYGWVKNTLFNLRPWFIYTEIFPPFLTVLALGLYLLLALRFIKQNKNISLQFYFSLFSPWILICLVTGFWIAEVIFGYQTYHWTNALLITWLFALGYHALLRSSAFDDLPEQKKETGIHFPQYQDRIELDRLLLLMDQQQVFTQSKLSLAKLSKLLKLPERYVSYLINKNFEMNFHQFVNKYRVQEVLKKLHDPAQQHKTLLALALESGFNSKSAFNDVFKAQTGKSPSAYLKMRAQALPLKP